MEESYARTVPVPITISIFAVAAACSYPAALSCIMSDPTEVLISLLAGAFSFLGIIGNDTKTKIIVSSASSIVLYFMSSGYIKAFCIGLLLSYSQTVAEIHTSRLSLAPFRDLAISRLNILMTMQACLFFFLLAFVPIFKLLFNSFIFVFLLVVVQVVFVLLCAPTSPVELINLKDSSVLYGPVYKKLSRIFRDAPFIWFHHEYIELVDKYSGSKLPTQHRVVSIVEKVNISFISVGVIGLLSTISYTSIYLTVFTSICMFKWLYASKYPNDYIILTVLSIGAVLLLTFIYNVQPIFVILMGCSLYLVPSANGYLCLDAHVIGFSNTVRNILGVIVYTVLEKEEYLKNKGI